MNFSKNISGNSAKWINSYSSLCIPSLSESTLASFLLFYLTLCFIYITLLDILQLDCIFDFVIIFSIWNPFSVWKPKFYSTWNLMLRYKANGFFIFLHLWATSPFSRVWFSHIEISASIIILCLISSKRVLLKLLWKTIMKDYFKCNSFVFISNLACINSFKKYNKNNY